MTPTLLHVLLALTCIRTCWGVHVQSSLASSEYRSGRLQESVLRTLQFPLAGMCLSACKGQLYCKAFNYQPTTKTCELLSTRLCNNEAYKLNQDSTWNYYDILDDKNEEEDHDFYTHPICTERGRCSPKCERGVGQSCSYDIQCEQVTNVSHCTAPSPETPGVCSCPPHHWRFNTSLCIHQISIDSMTWTWIFKKIVNGMCSVTFTVRAAKELRLYLGSYDDWHNGISQYYIILGGWSNTQSILDRQGVRKVTVSTSGLITNDFQNFTIHWCSGQMRVRLQGGTDFISWNDPTPIGVRTIGFNTPSGQGNAHVFFPHNLVDPYFPTSADTGVIRTNGHHWMQYKLLPDASPTSNITFRFECRAAKDCKVLFARRTDHNRQFQVMIGGSYNQKTRLYNGRLRAWVVDADTPGILSGAVFRSFWIDVAGGSINIGQGDEDSDPLISYTDPEDPSRTFSHVSIATCCNDYGYWKIHSHRQFHEYPNGGYVL